MKHLQETEFWEESWAQHLETYLKAPPRCGIWIQAKFGAEAAPVLEIAGGSCRDACYLAKNGIVSTGSDFDEKTMEYLRHRFKNIPIHLEQADAGQLPFHDKSHETSFSNGFWVCYRDDEQIKKFALEQARVTRKWMIILVHNARNKWLVEDFARKAQTDKLYDIRFFDPHEILELVESFDLRHKTIQLGKFGGPADLFYSKRVKKLPNPFSKFAHTFVPNLYKTQSWEKTERVACIVELD